MACEGLVSLPGHNVSFCVPCSDLLGLSPFQAALSTISNWKGRGGLCAPGTGKEGPVWGRRPIPEPHFASPGPWATTNERVCWKFQGASGVGCVTSGQPLVVGALQERHWCRLAQEAFIEYLLCARHCAVAIGPAHSPVEGTRGCLGLPSV